ncbi:aminotransferase class I/II-fold pyridoxal phosphate-dependent enzyme [Spiractinospora alimapuensis]|uniref:MalY/PatB family protein n=1 Tax=Spiractinospora alimapuensis TaxID=2820884 RepID=UPI001F2D71DD|nr:aminotransferase class I/II-fold pyridoxal phosphate-dependent enzyme [Spiractinospora alimapuensis]QVQ51165.1 aminotransferase class I/II-fold pyridoxal phosphate-dependent enzyme [Spiractinospora alimapuensis]
MGILDAITAAQLRRRRSVKWQTYPSDVLPVWVAEMDTPLAEPIAAVLREAVDRGDTGYAHAGNLPEAFAGFAARRWGWQPAPAPMHLVADVMSGVVSTVRALTEPGARVLVNTPAYPPFFEWLNRIDRQIIQSPLGAGFRIDLDRLERDFAAGVEVYLLCSPHNPTGVVHTREELSTVAALADTFGVRVIVDEIHAPLTYPEATHTPFATLDSPAAARSVTMVSASKAWNLAGLKTALVVPGPEATHDVAIPPEDSMKASLLGILASEAAFDKGEEWLTQLLHELDHNRHLLATELHRLLPDVGYQPPQATYLAWLDCRALDLGEDPAATFLARGRVALANGPTFGQPGDGFARLNLATSPARVAEAARRIAVATRPTTP